MADIDMMPHMGHLLEAIPNNKLEAAIASSNTLEVSRAAVKLGYRLHYGFSIDDKGHTESGTRYKDDARALALFEFAALHGSTMGKTWVTHLTGSNDPVAKADDDAAKAAQRPPRERAHPAEPNVHQVAVAAAK